MFARLARAVASLSVVLLLMSIPPPAGAEPPATDAFQRTWARTDKPVADGAVSRTWMWGPEAFGGGVEEPYADAPGGKRLVQYYDKSRMEITNPGADPNSVWYVTNGLLVTELISGRLQLGDSTFEQHDPAAINIGGDADDPTGPTYATMVQVRNWEALPDDATITQRISRAGSVQLNDPALAVYGVTAAYHVQAPGIDHQVASPFWAFMNSSGPVWEGDALHDAALFENPFYATGLPLTEAYWATIAVGGTPRDVLLQCFERRCLTYTPGNSPGWQVEAGNVGRHYDYWRRVLIPNEQPPGESTYTLATQWSTGTSAEDPLNAPHGIHVDASGNVLVADSQNNRVLKFDASGAYVPWGPDGAGLTGLNSPEDVATDSAGNVYVADSGNSRVVRYAPDGTFLSAWGSYGAGDDEFQSVDAIAIDAEDNVYTADKTTVRIRVFDTEGTFLRSWGTYGSDEGQLVGPYGIAVSGNAVYVSDMNSHRVEQFDLDGVFIRQWGGYGSSAGKFDQPLGVATDAAGDVYVADNTNGRVQKFTADGEFVALIEAEQLSYPWGVALDASGTVFVASHAFATIFKFIPPPEPDAVACDTFAPARCRLSGGSPAPARNGPR